VISCFGLCGGWLSCDSGYSVSRVLVVMIVLISC